MTVNSWELKKNWQKRQAFNLFRKRTPKYRTVGI